MLHDFNHGLVFKLLLRKRHWRKRHQCFLHSCSMYFLFLIVQFFSAWNVVHMETMASKLQDKGEAQTPQLQTPAAQTAAVQTPQAHLNNGLMNFHLSSLKTQYFYGRDYSHCHIFLNCCCANGTGANGIASSFPNQLFVCQCLKGCAIYAAIVQ